MAEVSQCYATALFELGLETLQLDRYYQDALLIRDIFNIEPRYNDLFANPRLTVNEKEMVINKVFPNISLETAGLIILLLKKKRETDVFNVLQRFIQLVREYKNIITVWVLSAVALSDEQKRRIQTELSGKLKKQVEMETRVDSSLIGGLLIRINGMVIDGTIKKHLQTLKKRFA
ncbi:MAG: ATP synthase F1 subunit delta [Clostridiales bacterium]|jgi:F-type H+-transporting ATPase subunit delta|nr:ATP synthase F1 subunit delta [Clostridiales bacterium]